MNGAQVWQFYLEIVIQKTRFDQVLGLVELADRSRVQVRMPSVIHLAGELRYRAILFVLVLFRWRLVFTQLLRVVHDRRLVFDVLP